MESLGLAGALGIGVIVALAAPVLVWTLVIAGLRQASKKESPQRTAKPGVRSSKADV